MKGDLNLLPIRKSAISKQLLATIIALLIIVVGLVGYFFVFIPNNEKADVMKDIDNKEKSLDEYIGLDDEFNALIAERTSLNGLVASMDVVGNAKVLLSKVFVDIDNAVPVGVLLGSMEYTSNRMTFGGRTRGLVRISQFLVKLRQMDDVIAVKLHDVKYVDPDDLHETPEEKEEKVIINEQGIEVTEEENYEYENMPYYDFEITVIYNFNQAKDDVAKGGE